MVSGACSILRLKSLNGLHVAFTSTRVSCRCCIAKSRDHVSPSVIPPLPRTGHPRHQPRMLIFCAEHHYPPCSTVSQGILCSMYCNFYIGRSSQILCFFPSFSSIALFHCMTLFRHESASFNLDCRGTIDMGRMCYTVILVESREHGHWSPVISPRHSHVDHGSWQTRWKRVKLEFPV